MEKAEIVIIGAGVVGASVAYHLTRRGAKDVLILERERVQGLLSELDVKIDRSDLIKEVSIFAERSDISEELVRYINLKLAALGQPTRPSDPTSTFWKWPGRCCGTTIRKISCWATGCVRPCATGGRAKAVSATKPRSTRMVR